MWGGGIPLPIEGGVWGGGKAPDPTPSGEGDTPSPHRTTIDRGAFGASSLNPPPLKISGYATGPVCLRTIPLGLGRRSF